MVFGAESTIKYILLTGITCAVLSCQSSSSTGIKQTRQNANAIGQKEKNGSNGMGGSDGYTLQFNPPPGAKYYYTVRSESETEVEAGGKTVNNLNRSEVGLAYDIDKDKSGNFLLTMRYDKLHIYTKNGDIETEMDASHATASTDPVEKMLGMVKKAVIVATLNASGAVTNLTGYKELGDEIMSSLSTTDQSTRMIAQAQWDKTISEGLIKKTMDQLVGILPHSSIQIGDTWESKTIQKGEITFKVITLYTLKDIEDGVAFIESKGEMESDDTGSNSMGATGGKLTGVQKGKYQVHLETGMLIKNSITGKVEGTLQIMGRKIPIIIENSIIMNGRKIE